MRIAAFLARSGVASRRASEKLVFDGLIKINGETVTDPARKVTESDSVFYKEKKITLQNETRLWCYYKPRGLITTHNDTEGRTTVFDDIHQRHKLPRVVSVGRLDINSEGLLLLTNDGNFSRQAEMSKMPRCYRVRVLGNPHFNDIERVQKGVTIEGIHYAPLKIEYDASPRSNQWMLITLFEGKNREIRKIMEHIGCQVNRLIRVSYGPFQLGALKPHELTEIPKNQFLNILS